VDRFFCNWSRGAGRPWGHPWATFCKLLQTFGAFILCYMCQRHYERMGIAGLENLQLTLDSWTKTWEFGYNRSSLFRPSLSSPAIYALPRQATCPVRQLAVMLRPRLDYVSNDVCKRQQTVGVHLHQYLQCIITELSLSLSCSRCLIITHHSSIHSFIFILIIVQLCPAFSRQIKGVRSCLPNDTAVS